MATKELQKQQKSSKLFGKGAKKIQMFFLRGEFGQHFRPVLVAENRCRAGFRQRQSADFFKKLCPLRISVSFSKYQGVSLDFLNHIICIKTTWEDCLKEKFNDNRAKDKMNGNIRGWVVKMNKKMGGEESFKSPLTLCQKMIL